MYVLHKLGGEWCMHQQYFCVGWCCDVDFAPQTAAVNIKDEPRRLFEAVCPLEAPIAGGFGSALVWERGDG